MNTKEIDEELNRIVQVLISQNNIEVLLDAIPYEVKKNFIDDWKSEEASDD
jgi:hypothetical protein